MKNLFVLILSLFYSFLLRSQNAGDRDYTFNNEGKFGKSGVVNSISIQQDQKIIVAGDFYQYNGTSVHRIVRLNQDGNIDTSFNTGTGFDGNIYSTLIQP